MLTARRRESKAPARSSISYDPLASSDVRQPAQAPPPSPTTSLVDTGAATAVVGHRPADGRRSHGCSGAHRDRADHRPGGGRSDTEVPRARTPAAQLLHGTGRLRGPPRPSRLRTGGPPPRRHVRRHLRRHAGVEHLHRGVLPPGSVTAAPPSPGGVPHRLGHHRHLPDRLGTGGHRRLRLRGPREHLPERFAHLAHRRLLEPGRYRRRSARHLAGLGPVVSRPGQSRDPRRHGRLRPHLRDPHGRCHE